METTGFVKRFLSSSGATKLDEKVGNMVERHQHLGELVVDVYDNKGDILITNGLVGEEFDKNLESILKFFDGDVSSIGIYGMGGVGKTTLAKHINNRLRGKQKSVSWTTLSQEHTIATLQDEIAKFVFGELLTEQDEDKRAARLNKGISKRQNIIFIFDDVWECIDMKKLGDPLSVNGCKLLITTRSRKVCDQFDCERIIKVEILNEIDAKKLFSDTLRMSMTPEVQEIANRMVKLCDGLPLAIITIAGSMKGEKELDVWENAWNELRDCVLGQFDMEDKVFEVLKYSFDRLEPRKGKDNAYSRDQNCFLYCSLFPEDYKIKRNDLIRKWILEEYLDGGSPKIVHGRMHSTPSRKNLYLQGKNTLNRLINVCLLENVDANHVKMHDLVRDMAHTITGHNVKVICGHSSLKEIPNEQQWGEGLEKMSLMCNNISKANMPPNCPKLSTLLFSENPLREIRLSFFKQMCGLCILDLSDTNIKSIPRSLLKLKDLKALLLGGCSKLKIIPNLGKLSKLRELDLSSTAIKVLKVEKIFFDLKFLSLNRCRVLEKLPEGLDRKFPNLQCLHLPSHIKAPIEEIGRLEHMEEFSGVVRGVSEFNQLMGKRPSSTYLLNVEFKGEIPYPLMWMQVCECFQTFDHQLNKRNVEFVKWDLDSVKDNGVTSLGQDVQYLSLVRFRGLRNGLFDLLGLVTNLTSIECLELNMCATMECVYMNEQYSSGDAVTSTSTFPPSPPPCSFFQYLSVLKIENCFKMKKLGIPASQLQNLQQLYIGNCDVLEEVMEVSEDNGGGESREASVVSLPKLRHLSLTFLRSLKSLCNGLIICNSMERIVLAGCRALKKLPLVFGHPNYNSPPSVLKEVVLRSGEEEWWDKMEMGHDTDTIRPMLEGVVRHHLWQLGDSEGQQGFCTLHEHSYEWCLVIQ